MKPFSRTSVIGVLVAGLSLTILVFAQGSSWMTGNFMLVAHKGMQWVGGPKQTVYSGQVPRTYRFTSSTDPSGLWAVGDGDSAHATPIPTSGRGGEIEKSGKIIEIELRTTNQSMVSAGSWIDVPQHDNFVCGAKGAVTTVRLNGGAGSTQAVLNGSANRIFRFTSPDDPTGLWVRTDTGAELPIPTSPTAIDIGGSSLTLVVKTDKHRIACWQDIT